MVKYTVVIPMYNSQETIVKCLDSLIQQTDVPYEIVIINDGSTDNSKNICNNYAKKDCRIKIINQKNLGPSAARNIGINIAKGEYIIFVDADDYVSNNFFETIDKNIEDDVEILKYNIKYHGDRIDGNIFNTTSFPKTDGEKVLKSFINNETLFAAPWMYVFKKSLFIDNNLSFSENHIHEDYGLIPCLIIKAKNVKGIDYVGYNYIYSFGSLSTNQSYEAIVKRSFDMLFQYDFLSNFATHNIESDEIKFIFQNYITNNLIKKLKKLKNDELIKFQKELKLRKVMLKNE